MLRNGFMNMMASIPSNPQFMPNMQGMGNGLTPPHDPDIQTENQKFGNWTGQTDTKVMAQDLKRRGLIGAQSLIEDSPNVNDPNSIRNSESDWKVAAIQQILSNAKKLNLKSPEAINANRDVLIDNPKWKDAINNSYFNHIHPNFWSIITHSILPEQYAKYDKQNLLAKK